MCMCIVQIWALLVCGGTCSWLLTFVKCRPQSTVNKELFNGIFIQ
uniref:Uncharacterized protein n=1 Tax=Anguilla anguilla TaxID=7936 RepID=A0A0E9WLQ9_ANGAN